MLFIASQPTQVNNNNLNIEKLQSQLTELSSSLKHQEFTNIISQLHLQQQEILQQQVQQQEMQEQIQDQIQDLQQVQLQQHQQQQQQEDKQQHQIPHQKRGVEQVNTQDPFQGFVMGILNEISQILMKIQTSMEQRIRFEGNSGVTDTRSGNSGTQPYHQTLYSSYGMLNIHNHADFDLTLGMGEFAAVLNGVEFWTRHNDYLLNRPADDSTYRKTVPIDFPAVPPSVLSKQTVDAQIVEMREYFRAFATQNVSVRDYRPYFKPTLCYLEGMWTQNDGSLSDFASDRHFIDAANWKQLNERARFLINAGRKSVSENIPWLPSSLRDQQISEVYNITVGTKVTPITPSINLAQNAGGWFTKYRSTLAQNNQVVFSYVVTSQGLALVVFVSRHLGTGTAGKLQLNISCTGTGCKSATSQYCDDSGQRECGPFVGGTGGAKWAWNASEVDGLVYGPLIDCFDLDVMWSGVSGITGVQFLVPMGISPNVTVNMSAVSRIRIRGCQYTPIPVFANWEYRILCHPIKGDIPTNRLRLVDEAAMQMSESRPASLSTMLKSRRALFQLNPRNDSKFYDEISQFQFIDELMEQIPGLNNYNSFLTDTVEGVTTLHYKGTNQTLNAAYYHRFFAVPQDAMGRTRTRTAFNDETLWTALTNQTKVSPLGMSPDDAPRNVQRWSYAIPLELVYLTPLSSWNPYNITFWGRSSPSNTYPTAGGRDGSAAKPYNGTSNSVYYLTPAAFFGNVSDGDAADTSGEIKYVLDGQGIPQKCRASGHWIFFPDIQGVPGPVRQRYPIPPIHAKKDLAYKELKAIKDLMKINSTLWAGGSDLNFNTAPVNLHTTYSVQNENTTSVPLHRHGLVVASSVVSQFNGASSTVRVLSSEDAGHSHDIVISRKLVGDIYVYSIETCDGRPGKCWDGHNGLTIDTNVNNLAFHPTLSDAHPTGNSESTSAGSIGSGIQMWIGISVGILVPVIIASVGITYAVMKKKQIIS